MIPLSPKTQRLIEKLFPSVKEQEGIEHVLAHQCADNIPGSENSTPERLERIRFSVLKLTKEDGRLKEWVELAYIDWRDLFMAAGFGYDVDTHQKWADRILNE